MLSLTTIIKLGVIAGLLASAGAAELYMEASADADASPPSFQHEYRNDAAPHAPEEHINVTTDTRMEALLRL